MSVVLLPIAKATGNFEIAAFKVKKKKKATLEKATSQLFCIFCIFFISSLSENPNVLKYSVLEGTVISEYLKEMNGCLCEWHDNLTFWPSIMVDRKADLSGFTEGFVVPLRSTEVLCVSLEAGVFSQMKVDAIFSQSNFQQRESCWCSARTVVNYQWNHYSSNTSGRDERKSETESE